MLDRQKYTIGGELRVAISGTVGAGKSTATDNVGEAFGRNCRVFKEMIDRELLEIFYEEVANGSTSHIELLNQFAFLSSTIKRDIQSYYYKEPIKIYDRSIVEHIQIFAKKNLSYEEFFKYDFFQKTFLDALGHKGYDITFMLDVDPEENVRRIKERGRGSEQITDISYFLELNEMYRTPEFRAELEQYSDVVVYLDTTNMTSAEVTEYMVNYINNYKTERESSLFDQPESYA